MNKDLFENQRMEKSLEVLQRRISNLLCQLEVQTTRNDQLNNRQNEIIESEVYQLGLFFHRIRLFLIPMGSLREQFSRYVYRVLRFWRVHGFRSLLMRMRNPRLDQGFPPKEAQSNESAIILPEEKKLEEIIREHRQRLFSLPAVSFPQPGRRVNLVIDILDVKTQVNETATAVILATLLAESWTCELRIITNEETAQKHIFHQIVELNGIPLPEKVEFLNIQPADRKAEVLIGTGDLFLTTSWETTRHVVAALGENNIVFLVQEDERSSHPFDEDRLQLDDLFRNRRLHFVINSKILYDYLIAEGFETIFKNGVWYEPSRLERLFYPENPGDKRKKNFLFFASGQNGKHLLYLGLEAIQSAIEKGILTPQEWTFYFVGYGIPQFKIDGSDQPFILTDISWAEYLALIREIDLGLYLMYGPQPGAPLLDLAASGAVVVTNQYKNKRSLDNYSHNIVSRELTIESLVGGIEAGVKLVADEPLRMKNYQQNGILKDWRASFSGVLEAIENWASHVSD